MCNTEDFKFLAEMIQHVPLPLRVRYVFCCAPINRKMPFVCSMFLKFARQYSRNDTITFTWLCTQVGWPFSIPKTIVDLVHLESVFDVLDLYLWFSYRFIDIFPEGNLVRDIQQELDEIIQQGVFQITKLLQNSETATSWNRPDEDKFEMSQRRANAIKGEKLPRNPNTFSPTRMSFPDLKASPLRGRLTERLLAQGLLTPNMLQELKNEWDQSQQPSRNSSYQDESETSPFKKFRRKKPMKK